MVVFVGIFYGGKNKFRLTKWSMVTRSKQSGGLGVTDLECRNFIDAREKLVVCKRKQILHLDQFAKIQIWSRLWKLDYAKGQ